MRKPVPINMPKVEHFPKKVPLLPLDILYSLISFHSNDPATSKKVVSFTQQGNMDPQVSLDSLKILSHIDNEEERQTSGLLC